MFPFFTVTITGAMSQIVSCLLSLSIENNFLEDSCHFTVEKGNASSKMALR